MFFSRKSLLWLTRLVRWLGDTSQYSIWIEWEQTGFRPTRADVPGRHGAFACGLVELGEVLLSNGVETRTIQLLYFLSICRFQGSKHGYVAWLQFMGGV